MAKVFLLAIFIIGLTHRGQGQTCKDSSANTTSTSDEVTFSVGAVENLLQLVDLAVEWLYPTPAIPDVDKNIWWGDDDLVDSQDTSIRPYKTEFKRTERLFEKLNDLETLTAPLNNANFTYGMNTDFLKTILDYWQNKYDFKTREARLNKYPQFMTNVQGLDIHFYHIKPETTNKRVITLLMLHGWPVANAEYLHLFPELLAEKEGYDYVFEIIAPSIPGFGYSQGTNKIGLNTYQVAIIFKNLMTRLGFEKFYIHGGDFGEIIAADMMTLYQDDVLGLHTNFPYSLRPKSLVKYLVGGLNPNAVVEPQYADRLYPVSSYAYYLITNFGYFHIHATKPDTLGVALKDSPAGIASWMLTIFNQAVRRENEFDGGLLEEYDIDDLLDFVTIMWDAEAIVTANRFYAEFSAWFQDPNQFTILINPTKVPYACIKFPTEVIYQPDRFIMDKFPNLVHSTTTDSGGHFAAFQKPQVLLADLWVGVQKLIEFNEN